MSHDPHQQMRFSFCEIVAHVSSPRYKVLNAVRKWKFECTMFNIPNDQSLALVVT